MTDINNNTNFLCPICHETMMIPRLYPCGHNICEECMIKNDHSQNSNTQSMSHLPIYKCPICRHETIKEWWSRPINNSLIDVLSQLSEEYKNKHLNHQRSSEETYAEVVIPQNINLAYMCKKMREFKANEFYKQILPILYKASLDGKPFITISSEHANISNVADILANKLIKQNGIYRFIANQRECQIELVPTENQYHYSYDNNNYNTDSPTLNNEQNNNNLTTQNNNEQIAQNNNEQIAQNNNEQIAQNNEQIAQNNEQIAQNSEQITQQNSEETINIFQPFLQNNDTQREENNDTQVDGINVQPEQFTNTNIELVEEQNSEIRNANGIIAVSVQNSGPNFNERASRDISRFVVQNILRNLNNLSSPNNS